MELVDGHGFDWRGVTGAFLADAVLTGTACLLLALVLRRSIFRGSRSEDLDRLGIKAGGMTP